MTDAVTDPEALAYSPEERRAYMAHAEVGTTLAFWAARQPDAIAIADPNGGETTFAEIEAMVNRVARVLRAAGLRPGDGMAVAIPNRVEFIACYYAALRLGLRFTPVNWHLTGEEMGYIVDDCEALAFVADERVAEAASVAGRLAPRLVLKLAVGGSIEGFEAFDERISGVDTDLIDAPSRGRWMLYTSGTTGRPKGVVRPQAPPNLDAMTAGSTRPGEFSAASLRAIGLPDMRMRPGVSRSLVTGPLYHGGPLNVSLTVPFAAGVGVVLMDDWSAESTLQLIERYSITHSNMVPTMFHRLLQLPEDVRNRYDVSSLVYVWHGAAACPVAVKRAIIEWWGPVLLEYYSASEGPVTYVSSEDWLRRPGTVGRPVTPDRLRIVGDDGEPLPAGEVGTVYVKVPELGRFHYFKSPEKTDGSYRGEYYTTGDIGYVDDDGFLFLTDRTADLIVSGGVNIYPAEIEAALLTHPAVGDAAVIGVPDAEWGERVLAVVELAAGYGDGLDRVALSEALRDHCRERVARFKVPRQVDFVEHLPRLESGKLAKHVLRQQYRERAGTSVGVSPSVK